MQLHYFDKVMEIVWIVGTFSTGKLAVATSRVCRAILPNTGHTVKYSSGSQTFVRNYLERGFRKRLGFF